MRSWHHKERTDLHFGQLCQVGNLGDGAKELIKAQRSEREQSVVI